MTDGELVAVLVRTGAIDAMEGALETLGGLRALSAASVAELERVAGVGPARAAALTAAFELGRRVAERRLRRGQPMRGPRDVHAHFAARLREALCEHFIVVLLDGRHRVLGDVVVSSGTLTASLVHPREVFRPAIQQAAAAVVLVHNHPSGDPAPSTEDHGVTARLRQAGEVIGIRVVDHVIVADGGYYSFQEAGELP